MRDKMTIYIKKSGAELDVGESEGGDDLLSWVFSTDKLLAKFWRRDDGPLNYWRWGLGTTLSETDSYYMRIKIKTGATLGGPSIGVPTFCGFHLAESSYSNYNTVAAYTDGRAAYVNKLGAIHYDDAAAVIDDKTTNYMVAATQYYWAVDYGSVRGTIRARLYNSALTLLATAETASVGAKEFDVDTVGFMGQSEAGGSSWGYITPAYEITEIQANSGIEFEESSSIIYPKKVGMVL